MKIKPPKDYFIITHGLVQTGDLLFASALNLWKEAKHGVDVGEPVDLYFKVARKDTSAISKTHYGEYK